MNQINTKTPVMILQELMVQRKLTPQFELIHSAGTSHEPEFHYLVIAGPVKAKAIGRSKKEAKHEAARIALEKLKEIGWYIPDRTTEINTSHRCRSPSPCSPIKVLVNHIGALKDLCAEKRLPDPEATLISDIGPPHARKFTVQYRVGSIKYSAVAPTKKAAKQEAARRMLQCLMDTLDNAGSVDIVSFEEFEKLDMNAKEMWKDVKNTNPDKSRKISQYHKCLNDLDNDLRSQVLDIFNESEKSPWEQLEKITNILEVNMSIDNFPHKKPQYALKILKIQTDPEFAFYGSDIDEKRAVLKAAVAAIEYLKIMLS